MYVDLEGQFLLVAGRIIQLGVANAFCTQFILFYYKDGEVTGDMENVKRSLA
jgi:hypothetical protein